VNAGRELDALVAEKVMGAKPWIAPGHGPTALNPPRYSTDIGAAWAVVEKLSREVGSVEVKTHRRWMGWTCDVRPPDGKKADGFSETSAAHAICLAALRAVGAEVPA
jgi:hypothetical protein